MAIIEALQREDLAREDSDLDMIHTMSVVAVSELYRQTSQLYSSASLRVEANTALEHDYDDLVDCARIIGRIVRTRPDVLEDIHDSTVSSAEMWRELDNRGSL